MAGIDPIGELSNVSLDPLVEVVHRRAADEDLVAVPMVVDSDRGVRADELALERHSLFGAPAAARGARVEYDGVDVAAEADVERVVAPGVEQVQSGVVAGPGGAREERRRAEDDDSVGLERAREIDGFGETEEMERLGSGGHDGSV